MAQRFYLDSSIWMDFHEQRSDGVRPLGEFAYLFFKYCKERKCEIIYSEIVLDELTSFYKKGVVEGMLGLGREFCRIVKVEITDKEMQEAKKIKKEFEVPFGDALHAVIARGNNAVLVSRDFHFELLKEIVESKKPEEII